MNRQNNKIQKDGPKEYFIGCLVVIAFIAGVILFFKWWGDEGGGKRSPAPAKSRQEKKYLSLDGKPCTEQEAFDQKARCFMCGKKADRSKTVHGYNMCSEKCRKQFLKENPDLR
jgi:hypothetical protein